MSARKRWLAVAAFVIAGVLALVGWTGVFAQDEGGFKLEGAWVARVTSFNEKPWPFVTQWSYVVNADPSRRKGTIHGSLDVAFPSTNPSLAADFSSAITGEVIQTGPDTLADNSLTYAIRKASPVNQIVSVAMASGEGRWLGPDKIEWTIHFAIYLPSADTNGDGIPEGDPVTTFDATTVDTRVPLGR